MLDLKLFIGNEWVEAEGGAWVQSMDPAKGEPIARVCQAGRAEVEQAIAAARRAFDSGSWPDLEPDERAEYLLRAAAILRRRQREFAAWETRDVGKPIRESYEIDIAYSARAFEYYANLAREVRGEVIPLSGKQLFNFVTWEPYGVVAVLSPWNFPLHLATRSLCPALAAGNTVVLKPSALAPITTTLLGEVVREAGFPPGVVNVLNGPGATVGEALVGHRGTNLVAFTGSVEVGKRILAASAEPLIKKCILELGGKSPFIVEPDAHLEDAVRAMTIGFCLNQGEVCAAATRLFVHESIYDRFLAGLVRRIGSLRMGDPLDERTQLGSLISQEHLARVDAYVKEATAAGGRLLCGGERFTDPPCDRGSYYRPTIIETSNPEERCAQEEIFGPVLVARPYRTLDEAIDLANRSDFALGAIVWSSDYKTLHRAAKRLDAGTVWMNTDMVSRLESPFGGHKNTGLGKENGYHGLLEYLRMKNHLMRVADRYPCFHRFDEDILGSSG